MVPKQFDAIRHSMQAKETEELMQIYETHDADEWSEAAFEAVRLTLLERGETPPEPNPCSLRERKKDTGDAGSGDAWQKWVLATTAGWVVGTTIVAATLEGAFSIEGAAQLRIEVGIVEFNIMARMLGIAGLGASLGIFQWLALRTTITNAGWWVPATVGGWVVGFGVISKVFSDVVPSFSMTGHAIVFGYGAFVGTAQWLVLRSKRSSSGLWVVATVVALLVSAYVNSLVDEIMPFRTISRYVLPWAAQGAVIGAITSVFFARTRASNQPPLL